MGRLHASGRISPRDVPGTPVVPETEDIDITPGESYHLVALARIERNLSALVRMIVDHTKIVDEYSGGSATEDILETSAANVSVLPTFDQMNEKITSILVTGPPSTAFVLNIGNREWTLVTGVNGTWTVNGLSILLSRNDNRLLTPGAAGNWSLELMGIADAGF